MCLVSPFTVLTRQSRDTLGTSGEKSLFSSQTCPYSFWCTILSLFNRCFLHRTLHLTLWKLEKFICSKPMTSQLGWKKSLETVASRWQILVLDPPPKSHQLPLFLCSVLVTSQGSAVWPLTLINPAYKHSLAHTRVCSQQVAAERWDVGSVESPQSI